MVVTMVSGGGDWWDSGGNRSGGNRSGDSGQVIMVVTVVRSVVLTVVM